MQDDCANNNFINIEFYGRYLSIGIVNLLFGYFLFIILYKNLSDDIEVLAISILSSVISITQSYFMYKLFVFKTEGSFFSEYYRSIIVYSISAILSGLVLKVMVDLMDVSIWYAQMFIVILIPVFTYIGNSRYIFKEVPDGM